MVLTPERFPKELAGKADFDYITPKGRRLTEYEAVTVYTQPQVEGGGLQACGYFLLRPDGRPLFDLESTALRCTDWFAYRDPNQMWQRPYYVLQAEAERSIERATATFISVGGHLALDERWIEKGVGAALFPFSHYEYGLFRILNVAARESLSDTVNSILLFNAADKLRHAQAISILGLDLESVLPGFDGTVGRSVWLDAPEWQPVRRLVEEVMAVTDWCEIVAAVNLGLEPVFGEPMRRLVFGLSAAHAGDSLVPVIAMSATADWHRNAAATKEFVNFLCNCPGGEKNASIIQGWVHGWRERVLPVAEGMFGALEATLQEPGLAQRAKACAEEEIRRVAATVLDGL